ncbi:MAG: amidohydrolase family protein [Candidatus Lokiarchaeota archaeon]|nr:amidohydrolase family protein [Candidatus Lokiarchaeota archaeon]
MKAITNATILCPVLGLIKDGTIVFDEKKIHDIGQGIKIPPDAETIDVGGKYVLPGFIDAHAHQGLFDGSIGNAGMDGNEATNPVTPELRGIDSFNPDEPSLKDILKGGVTCVNTGPGSANVVGGQAFVFKPNGSTVVDQMVVLAPSGLKVAFGENPKRVYGTDKKTPSTRMGVASILRKTLIEAQDYLEEWRAYGAKARKAKGEGDPAPQRPKTNIAMEVVAKVLKKEIPLHAHAHRADDISTVIRIAEEFGIRVVLIHCTEGHKIADYLAEKGFPAVIGPTIHWTSKPETVEKGFDTPVILNKAGVKVALQTDSITPMNHFPLLPMYSIKHGMSREDALKCVTLYPAEILGLEKEIGSLEKGKDADIVVWSGHPFEFYSNVEQVFIDGIEMDIE